MERNRTSLVVSSSAFSHKEKIPAKYTCDGEDVNPPLKVENIPTGTKSLVLIMDDPDAPGGNWDHWLVWNIPPEQEIIENKIPGDQGLNSFKQQDYKGPCPPSGTHHYHFKCYALNTLLTLDNTAGKEDLENEMDENILAEGELIGLYNRSKI